MNRTCLHLTRAIVLTIAAVVLGAPGTALAQNRQTLRVSTPAVPDDWHTKMLYVFKDELEKSAPGRFDVQIHHSGTLFKQGTEAAAMARGNLEMALLSMQDFAKQAPDLSLFTAGYLIRDVDHLRKVFEGPIGAEINQRVSATMDMQIINTAYLGTRQLNLREPRSVRTPADLAGVKLRMPGSKEWLFLGQALGGNPTPLAFNEIYLALKTGTIDGQDNPLPTVRAAKFYEVTKQLTLTGHLVQDIHLVLANKTWNAMTPDDQRKVRDAARIAARFNDDNRVREESEIVEFFRKQGLAVTTPDIDVFRQHVQKAYLQSEFAKDWTPGMLERVNAVR
jgi:tripartite ATP-independent transporter DctP family solute receptor